MRSSCCQIWVSSLIGPWFWPQWLSSFSILFYFLHSRGPRTLISCRCPDLGIQGQDSSLMLGCVVSSWLSLVTKDAQVPSKPPAGPHFSSAVCLTCCQHWPAVTSVTPPTAWCPEGELPQGSRFPQICPFIDVKTRWPPLMMATPGIQWGNII